MNQYSAMNRSQTAISEENARFMSGVYKWMSLGILLTGIISYFVANTPEIMNVLLQNRFIFVILLIAQIGTVLFLSLKIKQLSPTAATLIYFLYAALTGLTFSAIFIIYTNESIQGAFLVTTFSFAGLSAFGYMTKRDLGPIGTFLHMGLWGLIGFGILSLFFPTLMSGRLEMIYSLVGIVVFAGLTAYDTQKIKNSNIIGNEGSAEDHKETIIGALTLYLDFINLFLMILRLTGNRRR